MDTSFQKNDAKTVHYWIYFEKYGHFCGALLTKNVFEPVQLCPFSIKQKQVISTLIKIEFRIFHCVRIKGLDVFSIKE